MTETTAVEYLDKQTSLEKTAQELMPYDPNTCTYTYGPIRQTLFACLTCKAANKDTPNGICYSCSIQCHADHDLVELFTKRDFCCDCGTTRIPQNGCCRLRYAPKGPDGPENFIRRESVLKEIPAEDIPCYTNEYNANFEGKFCSCKRVYDPNNESGNMVQCNFGDACGEDWYHEECILGLEPGLVNRKKTFTRKFEDGVNVLDMLPEAEEDAENTAEITKEYADDDGPEPLVGFPDFEAFEGFICWKCVQKHQEVFNKLLKFKNVCLEPVYHVSGAKSLKEREERLESRDAKRRKTDTETTRFPFSVFLVDDYQDILKNMFIEATLVPQAASDDFEAIKKFLLAHKCLYDDDPVYEPPEDEDLKSDSGSSLFSLGSKALESLPRHQAAEGARAYEIIKSKLKEFLKPFAERGEVVTEDKIRSFFNEMHGDMAELKKNEE